MICQQCRKHIPAHVNYCAYCGAEQAAVVQHRPIYRPRLFLPWYILALPLVPLVVAIGIGLALYFR